MRLDKFLSELGIGTRSEIKKYLKQKEVTVNETVILKPDFKIDSEKDRICFKGQTIIYEPFVYYMMNKPPGVVTATKDEKDQTVMDLFYDNVKGARKNLFPVGRLDKDTQGLLLITNDGALSHELLSPAKHIEKTYYVKVDGALTKEDVECFLEGIDIGEKNVTKPSRLTILISDSVSEAEVVLTEGKFHQVKRMFAAVGKPVLFLKRISMGKLVLDHTLKLGDVRKLTDEEVESLKEK